jgi:hypothetical protein
MSDPLAVIIDRIDDSISLLSKAPLMWGSPESMELQVLLLLELRAMAARPSVLFGRRESGLRAAYAAFVRKQIGDEGANSLLSASLGNRAAERLHALLTEFSAQFDTWLSRDPMIGDDLVLEIEGAPGEPLPFSAVCRYYEHFQKGLQSLARQQGKAEGLAPLASARASEYATPSLSVSASPDGARVVRLTMSQPHHGQVGLLDRLDESERVVRGAVGMAARVVRWAGEGAHKDGASLIASTSAEREETVFQAMKMLPGGGIVSVRLGGRLLDGEVELRPQHADPLMSAIEREHVAIDCDREGRVRALDLDQAWFRLRSREADLKCWVREDRQRIMSHAEDALHERSDVHVFGKLYKSRRRQWVTVTDVRRKGGRSEPKP